MKQNIFSANLILTLLIFSGCTLSGDNLFTLMSSSKTGINFKNYAVMGTPTMFLLNSKGIIIEKIATVEQLLVWSKNN